MSHDVGDKKPPKEHQFKPGQSGNPEGGRAHNPVMRMMKRLTNAEIAEIGKLVIARNTTELKALIVDAMGDAKKGIAPNPKSKHSTLKVWMATIALKGITKGDAHAMDVLLNRLAGRVKEQVELTGKDGGPIRSRVEKMTKEERAAELKRLRAMSKDAGED